MASRIVQYFADKLKTVKDYPITLTKAVYDESGNRLDNKLSEVESNVSQLDTNLTQLDNELNGEGGSEMNLYNMVKNLYDNNNRNMEEFAISFFCVGRGYVSFAYDKSFAAGVAANFETHHFKINSTVSFKVKTDGTYRIIKLYSYSGSSEKVLSDTIETVTANTSFSAQTGHESETGAIYVTIVIPVE